MTGPKYLLYLFMFTRGLIHKRLFAQTARVWEDKVRSSCKAGTVLNLKMRKSGNEPVALEDHDYPEWLWDCLDKSKMDEDLKTNDLMKWRKKHLGKINKAKINNNNFLSKMS